MTQKTIFIFKEYEYAATVATIILETKDYTELKQFLQIKSIWDTEFETLEKELQFCALPIKNK
jgi:hypothetical protein